MASEPKYKLPGKWPKSTWKTISPEETKPLRELYRQARYLDAFELARQLGPLQTWKNDGGARNFAADLAGALAGYRLSDWLDVSAYRNGPEEEKPRVGYAALLRARRGPLIAWWFMDRNPIRPDNSANYKYRWLCLRSAIARQFRDFELSKKYSDEASAFCERPEFIPTEDCFRLRSEDRLEEAIASARKAYAINPVHAAAQRQIVEILLLQNKDEECFAFMEEALKKTQDSYLLSLKIRLLIEREEFEETLGELDLYEKWAPLIELDGRRWLYARRADACYELDRFDEAAGWAQKVGGKFYDPFAERLKTERRRIRVRLPVGFIRQDHNTCGPATLTALANFWGLPADHGEVAGSVGYDGTYDYQERKWVEENGFHVREFKVTWEASRTLIDAGIPFALVTSWPGSAHLQAVIGYDDIWKSLLIRDPGERDVEEFDWKKTEEMYRAVGPRGMAFVPMEKKELLDRLELPDAVLFDDNYRISLALFRHQRSEAIAICEEMERKFPGQRLTVIGKRLVADYDDNVPEQLACVRKLLDFFPKDERHSHSLLFCLRDLGRREERLALLESLTARKDCHALFWKELAVELSDDSREQGQALKYLKRAHGRMPWHAPVASKIAGLLWNAGEIAQATDIYRFVACAEHKREGASRSYFDASRQTRRIDEAVGFLRSRFLDYGTRSGDPIRTLFYALEQLDRIPEAFSELEKAMTMRPKDGALLCYAADVYRRYGRKEEARKILEAIETECPRGRWLRTSARLEVEKGNLQQALKFWEEVGVLEPLAEDAHREIADLLSKTQGRREALIYLRAVYERFPFNTEISRLLLSWLKTEDQEEAIALCRTMVSNHPADAWAARELASQLSNIPKYLDEALEKAQLGRNLDPRACSGFNILGSIYRKLGRLDEAREAFREAIRLEVDDSYAIEKLIDLDSSQEEKRKDLLFVREELVKQVVFGDGLMEFRSQAKRALPPEEALLYLREARDARPDLWQAWSSLTYHLSHTGLHDEALATALETAKQFPLMAGSWRNLGDMYSQQSRWAEAAGALEKSVSLSSNWVSAITELSEACQRMGEVEKARAILESSLRNNPTSSVLGGCLAEVLYYQGEKAEALQQVRRVLELDPKYNWALGKLRDWGTREECLEVCRSLTVKRPGEAHSWRVLADNLDSSKDLPEMLQALDRAISLAPQESDAYDLKAMALAENKKFEEALAVCRPVAWGDFVPLTLRGRAAWIENERGNRKEAIRLMEKVVADDSAYYWGWGRLSDWLLEEGKVPGAVSAADRMVKLRPGGAQAFGFRADARLKQGNRSGAIEDFRRAHALDPEYGFVTWTLFDLILDDDEYDEARKLLAEARQCSNEGKVMAAEIKLDLHEKRIPEALDKLKALGTSKEATTEILEQLQNEFERNERREDFNRELDVMVSSRTATGPVLYHWVRRETALGNWNLKSVIDDYLELDKKLARYAVDGFVHASGDKHVFKPYAEELLRVHGKWIAEETYSWGLVCYALDKVRRYKQCAEWAADWQERRGVQPWMLLNLNGSLRNLWRQAEFDAVCKRVLEMDPSNQSACSNLAFDAALKGDPKAAEALLQKLNEKDLGSYLKVYFMRTRKILDFSKDREQGRVSDFGNAKRQAKAQLALIEKPDWEIVRVHYLGLARLAKLSGKWSAVLYRVKAGNVAAFLFRLFQKR